MISPSPEVLGSSLLALQQQVANVFMHSPMCAGGVWAELFGAASAGTLAAEMPTSDLPMPWNSCKGAASLVTVLACPKEMLHNAAKFNSQCLGSLPTLQIINNTPTTSFAQAFRTAKARARGEEKFTTVMAVSFVDVHIFELARRGKAGPHTSFAHTFVAGFGPEGVVIWQGWGEHGYGLDQYIQRGGATTRTWQEAGDFVDRFEKVTEHKGRWDAKRNKLYQQCFEVEINKIWGPNGPSKPIVPKYETWVRILVFEDVTVEHVHKFTFA